MPPPPALLVNVTWEDIHSGERQNVCHCPVARAAARALGVSGADEEVSVEHCIEVWTGDGWDVYDLPAEVHDWINAFDSGSPVTPITFTAAYAQFVEG